MVVVHEAYRLSAAEYGEQATGVPRAGMLWRQSPLVDAQALADQPFGLFGIAALGQDDGQVVPALEGVRVLVPKVPLPLLQCRPQQRLRLRRPGHGVQYGCEIVLGGDGSGSR